MKTYYKLKYLYVHELYQKQDRSRHYQTKQKARAPNNIKNILISHIDHGYNTLKSCLISTHN